MKIYHYIIIDFIINDKLGGCYAKKARSHIYFPNHI